MMGELNELIHVKLLWKTWQLVSTMTMSVVSVIAPFPHPAPPFIFQQACSKQLLHAWP